MTDLLDSSPLTGAGADPDHAAADATVRALLSCWVRETPHWSIVPASSDGPVPDAHAGALSIALPGWNARIHVGLARISPTFRHEFALPAMVVVDGRQPRPISPALLTALLTERLATESDRAAAPDAVQLRVLDSHAAIAENLRVRADEIDRLWGPDPLSFGETEQALLLGHLVHPTPKSRGEMSGPQRRAFSPEAGARFAVHWLAVEPHLVRHASATDAQAPELAERLLRTDPATDLNALDAMLAEVGPRVLLPAHPFEAAHLAADPATAGLFDAGSVVDLGPLGSPYLPTTSVRTVHRPDAPWQLKFSLHVRVTNSLRVTLPKELDRAVEAARLARTSVGAHARAVAPDFVLVHDPAYLTVVPDAEVASGFSVLFRENRWGPGGPADVSSLTTLCQDHPYHGRSRLAAVVAALARRERRDEAEIAREWFTRFCDVVVSSLLRLYLDVGLCFEAHQQNTLVELEQGWPVRGVYRDSQGYFHRQAAHDDLSQVIPRIGEDTESIFPEELADERLTYYLFVNLTLGVINALGACVDEEVLLRDLARRLDHERRRGGRYPASLLDRLLDDDRWPCKANLRTRVHDMDELVGDISTQSVYVTVPNPLKEVW